MPVQNFNTLSAANPYRNQEYKKSGWQNFLSALGFRTQADAWKENMSVQAAEYDAALAQKQFDTEYNSPQAQADRMRAAGLNPDLDPSSIDSGSAAPMGEDPSTPMQSTGDEGTLMQVASGIMNAFSSALGMITSFQGIHRNYLENSLLDLDISKGVSGFAERMWPHFLPSTGEGEIYDNGESVSPLYLASQSAQMFSKTLPKKYRRQFLSNVETYFHGAPGTAEEYETWRKNISERKGYEVDKRTNFSFIDKDLAVIADELADLHSRLEKQSLKTDIAEGESDESKAILEGKIADNISPETAAAAENSSNSADIESARFQKEIHSSINKIISSLKSNDDPFSKLLLIFISSMQLNLIPR